MNFITSLVEIRHTIRFAARNLKRNSRRSVATLMSIAFGFSALALFAGYTMDVYQGLRDQAVYGELLGHLTISRPEMAQEGHLHPEKYLLDADNISKIEAVIRQIAPEAKFAPRLEVTGMISNGQISTIFLAEGVEPTDMRALRGRFANASGTLDPDKPTGITVSRGLAALLALKEGDNVSLLGSTMRGQVNAIDEEIADTFDTGNAATNDKMMFMPLEQARALYDAKGRADRLTVVLPDVDQTDALAARISAALNAQGMKMSVQTWHKLSVFYRQVKGMLNMIFAFLFTIVLVISTMALANVISMNVVERTREIGTLRALGMQRGSIIRLFSTEVVTLVVFGCLVGLVLTFLLGWGINAANISYVPPNSTSAVPLTVGFDLSLMVIITLLLAVLGSLAAWLPARRAARQPIIDALGHV
jgi:putative ABC transport system permease protein